MSSPSRIQHPLRAEKRRTFNQKKKSRQPLNADVPHIFPPPDFFHPLETFFPIIGKPAKIFSNHWKTDPNFFQSLENFSSPLSTALPGGLNIFSCQGQPAEVGTNSLRPGFMRMHSHFSTSSAHQISLPCTDGSRQGLVPRHGHKQMYAVRGIRHAKHPTRFGFHDDIRHWQKRSGLQSTSHEVGWQSAQEDGGECSAVSQRLLRCRQSGVDEMPGLLERFKKRYSQFRIGKTPIFPISALTLRQSLPMAFPIAIQEAER